MSTTSNALAVKLSLEGLAQVLVDLAAASGNARPMQEARHALNEAYDILIAEGAHARARSVLLNARRIRPRPANDAT